MSVFLTSIHQCSFHSRSYSKDPFLNVGECRSRGEILTCCRVWFKPIIHIKVFKNEFAQDLYDETLGFESLLEKWFFQPILLGIYVRFRDCKIDDFFLYKKSSSRHPRTGCLTFRTTCDRCAFTPRFSKQGGVASVACSHYEYIGSNPTQLRWKILV